MLPVYRYMDSYPQPHQRNHPPYPPHYYPGWEAVSPQLKMDPVESPVTYEPWSYGGSYVYPSPVQCHGCCSHSCPPGYLSFRPPHSHYPPTPPLYYQRSYPPYHEAYPPYCIPPPHYSMEQPKYDYDKNIHGSHCCACPNNSWNHKEDKGAKIEEQEPEVEKKECNSSGPVKSNSYPYPIVWIPPEYMKNKDSGKPSELEPMVWNGWFPLDMKNDQETSKAAKSDPKAWNTQFPLDMNNIRSLMKGGNEKRNNSQHNEDDRAEFPYPVIWIPSYEKPGEVEKNDVKDTNTSPKVTEESPVNFKFIPVKLFGNGDHGDKPVVVEDTSRSMDCSKMEEQEAKPKDITVKQMEEIGANKSLDDTEKKSKTIPVKQLKEENEGKLSSLDKNAERRSQSSPKASKLPPVCLRVDPLPRRKSGNGNSRSPSPPGLKSKVQHNPDGTSKAPSLSTTKKEVQQDSKAQMPNQNKAEEVQPRKETEVVEVNEITEEGMRKDARDRDHAQMQVNVPIVSNEEVSRISTAKKADMCEREYMMEDEGAIEKKPVEERKEKKSNLSTTEAAILIQSAYRGFGVRKWEPLKKLRQIEKVREQVNEVRELIHKLESSPELQEDEKQKILIGETIMGLLLQLDTIQGLHPNLRYIRKSVARELICLQEELDCLTSQKAEEPESTQKGEVGVEDLCETAHDNGYMPTEHTKQPKEEEEHDNIYENISDGSSQRTEASNESKEPNHLQESEQLLLEMSNSHVKEHLLADKEVHVDSVKESTESSIVRDEVEVIPKTDEDVDTSYEVNEELKLRLENKLPLVVDEKDDSEVEKLTGSPIKDTVHELEVGAETMVVEHNADRASEPEVNLLAETPLEVKEKMPRASNTEENVELDIEKGEDSVSQDSSADSKVERLLLLPPVEENIEENMEINVEKGEDSVSQDSSGDSKPEEILLLPLAVEKREEKLEEVPKPEELLSVQPSVEESLETRDTSKVEEMETTVEDDKDDDSTSLLAINKPVAMEIENGNCPCSALEILEDISVELPHKEEEETEESEAVANDVVYLSLPRIIEEVVMDSAPVSDMLSEETSDPYSDANANLVPLDEPEVGREEEGMFEKLKDRKLVEENEKLREMLEKLMETGKQQLTAISVLNGKVKDLERKLSRKKKLGMRRHKTPARSAFVKSVKNL